RYMDEIHVKLNELTKENKRISEVTSGCSINIYTYPLSKSDTETDVKRLARHLVTRALPDNAEASEDWAKTVDRMILLLPLQFDAFEKLRESKADNVTLLKETISKSSGLDGFYTRELQHIAKLREDLRHQAASIIRWVHLAARPLTILELSEALLLRS